MKRHNLNAVGPAIHAPPRYWSCATSTGCTDRRVRPRDPWVRKIGWRRNPPTIRRHASHGGTGSAHGERDKNRPSVIMWSLGNEWHRPQWPDGRMGAAADPSRPRKRGRPVWAEEDVYSHVPAHAEVDRSGAARRAADDTQLDARRRAKDLTSASTPTQGQRPVEYGRPGLSSGSGCQGGSSGNGRPRPACPHGGRPASYSLRGDFGEPSTRQLRRDGLLFPDGRHRRGCRAQEVVEPVRIAPTRAAEYGHNLKGATLRGSRALEARGGGASGRWRSPRWTLGRGHRRPPSCPRPRGAGHRPGRPGPDHPWRPPATVAWGH